MPNPVKERSPEQTAISVSITKDLLTRIDDRASEVGLSRSRYIAVIFKAGRTIDDGTRAAAQLLQHPNRATAVQAVNDLIAIGCAEAALRNGYRIPEDLSIAGFGNIQLAGHYRIPLTTADQPTHRLGLAAVELMNLLLARQAPPPKRLPVQLVVRASTAPATT